MIKGVFSVLPTPFTADGQIDIEGIAKVMDLYLRAGVDGLTAAGVTSETARLNDHERSTLLELIMAHVNQRVPVVVGTSADGLHRCIELTKSAKSLGAAAVMMSPPRMPKLNSDAVLRHYREVASAVDIPIIVQDYPPVSGFTMEPALLAGIAREISLVRGIKLEDPPTPYKIARVLERMEGRPISIYGGLGGMYLIEELMAGAAGAMTGFAIPEILVRVVSLFHQGKQEEAASVFYQTVACMRFEFQEGIGMAIRKEILRRRGAIANATTRPPAARMDKSTLEALDRLLAWFQSQHKEIQWTLD
ncbi:MAG: dihydrodipicolinate synthase family protein [Ignavibacteriales bacterium]|nr:dihydrodipicolinate synthase family protein [Ignavibacteriales bacterium]